MRSDPPVLVLLPHPDDEFAVLPFLRRAVEEGRELHLIWLTDGGAGRAAPTLRARESLDALAAAGIRCATCRFLGIDERIPDGYLHRHMARTRVALLRALEPFDGPIELWVPAWEGGHQDHDAAHALGRSLAKDRPGVTLQFPLYRSGDRWGLSFTALSPLRGMRVARREHLAFGEAVRLLLTCLRYRSQWRSFLGLLPVAAVRLLVLRRPMVLCEIDIGSALDRPHPGVLLYERRTTWRWLDLRSALDELDP